MMDSNDQPNGSAEAVVIKKYANRRLYNTETSTYVTLEDLAQMVRADRDFVVRDAKSGDDLTHSVLTQIIVEQESRAGGPTLLPIPFLRQLIRYYDDSIGKMVPSYLQFSMAALAKEQGFLLVAPVARYQRVQDQRLTWNVDLHDDAVDDVAFIDALLDRVSAQYAVDPARIYAVGFSGGARMSSRLACDLSDRIAAISAVAGLRFPEDCQPSRPVPVIAFHGRKDVINHYEHQPNSPDYWRMGVEDALTGWIGNNGCNARPKVERLGNNDARLAYVDCRQRANVTFYRSELANHTWPGTPLADGIRERWGPETVSDVPATTLTWAFFASHPMPAAD